MSSDVPRPAPGTRIVVEPGQWQLGHGHPGTTREVIYLVAVHPSKDPTMAWIHGHDIGCEQPDSDCRTPCYEILVPVAVLAAAAAGQP